MNSSPYQEIRDEASALQRLALGLLRDAGILDAVGDLPLGPAKRSGCSCPSAWMRGGIVGSWCGAWGLVKVGGCESCKC
ncbi:MAG: hypothetical protein ACYTG5_17130 [Planctomycetota bacterium]|jgi:hypothetical protein